MWTYTENITRSKYVFDLKEIAYNNLYSYCKEMEPILKDLSPHLMER